MGELDGTAVDGWLDDVRETSRGVTGDHLFVISATSLLFSCSDVSDCHRPFSTMCIALCCDNCLAQGQPVSLHS